MQLHRTDTQPQWATIANSKRNYWQVLAARTSGVLTVGNVLTAAGLVLSIVGAHELLVHHYWWGLAGLGVGRALDIADGYAADATGTKSPLGESFDATSDKIVVLLAILAFGIAHLAPWSVLLLLLLPHGVTALLVLAGRRQGRRIHPSRAGKISMALGWIGLLILILSRAIDAPAAHPLAVVGYVCIGISSLLGCVATTGYLREYRR